MPSNLQPPSCGTTPWEPSRIAADRPETQVWVILEAAWGLDCKCPARLGVPAHPTDSIQAIWMTVWMDSGLIGTCSGPLAVPVLASPRGDAGVEHSFGALSQLDIFSINVPNI